MRRLLIQIFVAISVFAGGIAVGAVWHARRNRAPAPLPPIVQRPDEKPWPLTNLIVSRSLQSHSFRTDKLQLNSNDDVAWRWLKESISKYPQNWVKLNITDTKTYGVVLYPPRVFESTELAHLNEELSRKGLPLVQAGKRYIQVQINVGNIICPDWHGYINADQVQLVYFEGVSA
jgi:hypothetical protein